MAGSAGGPQRREALLARGWRPVEHPCRRLRRPRSFKLQCRDRPAAGNDDQLLPLAALARRLGWSCA